MRDLEANLQYEYMDKVRGYVKQQEEQIEQGDDTEFNPL